MDAPAPAPTIICPGAPDLKVTPGEVQMLIAMSYQAFGTADKTVLHKTLSPDGTITLKTIQNRFGILKKKFEAAGVLHDGKVAEEGDDAPTKKAAPKTPRKRKVKETAAHLEPQTPKKAKNGESGEDEDLQI